MIPFFRKTRKKMADDNKPIKPAWPVGRYMRYAIGEIVLVVVGILIALQINNWNESRKQSISEKEFITSVKKDLKEDKDYINLVIELIEPRIEAFKVLNNGLPNLYNNDKKALDSIFKIYFNSQRTFYPISGSYQSAVSGNQINTYRNKDLIQTVIKLYNSTYNRLIENGQFVDERWAFLSKKYSYERRTGHFREMKPEQLTEFLDDVHYHYIQMVWYLKMLQDTIVEIDKITAEN